MTSSPEPTVQQLTDVLQRIIDLAEQALAEAKLIGFSEESSIDGKEIRKAFAEVDPNLYARLFPSAGRPDSLTREQVAGLNAKQRDTLITIALQVDSRSPICSKKHVAAASASSLVRCGLVLEDWSVRIGDGYRLTVRGRRAAAMLALETEHAPRPETLPEEG